MGPPDTAASSSRAPRRWWHEPTGGATNTKAEAGQALTHRRREAAPRRLIGPTSRLSGEGEAAASWPPGSICFASWIGDSAVVAEAASVQVAGAGLWPVRGDRGGRKCRGSVKIVPSLVVSTTVSSVVGIYGSDSAVAVEAAAEQVEDAGSPLANGEHGRGVQADHPASLCHHGSTK